MKTTYIFDFDGTLVDSMPYFGSGARQMLDDRGIAYPPNIVEIITPLGFGGTIAYYRDNLGLATPQSEGGRELIDRLRPYYRDTIPLKDGVEAFLRAAKKQGISLNVLTASPHENLDPCLKRLGVYDLFENVWSSDDFPTTKAEPATYVAAAERLGVTVEDCAFFDDNIHTITTAMTAGMCGIGMYDPSGEGFADKFRASADRYVISFADIVGEEF